MDPLTASIVIVLGKYALDKGGELAREVGPRALEAAREMFTAVLDRIGKKRPETAAEYPHDPETYQKPVEKELEAQVQADPDFKAQLEALLAQYEKAGQEHAAATGAAYQADVRGSGASAQGAGAQAAGQRGVVARDIGGPAITGDGNVSAGDGGVAVGRDVHGGITVGRRKETGE